MFFDFVSSSLLNRSSLLFPRICHKRQVITPGAPEVSIRVHVISNVPGAVEVDILPRLTGEAAVAALRSPQVITPHTAVGSRASGSGSGTYVTPIRGGSSSAAFPHALPGVDGGDGTRLRAGLDSFGTYAGLDNSLTGAEMRVLELTVVQDAEAVFGDPNSPRCMNNSHLICHPTVTYSFCRHGTFRVWHQKEGGGWSFSLCM